jgi:glycosyltransferase involved in cell wall biosynthesis
LVHICDQANAPYTRWLGAVPCVVTCHDLLAARCALGEFPDQPVRWSGRQYQRAILRGLARATGVVFVSAHGRGHGVRLTGLPPSRARVVGNAVAPVFRPVPADACDPVLRGLGIDPSWRFLLHVGGNQWYKNRPAVVDIFRRLLALPGCADLRLVMAGKPWSSALRRHVQRGAASVRIRECADLGDRRLAALYSASAGLVFPSREEGFGWPLIEAQACGCPVFASARAPLMEVAGAGACFFDIDDPDAAAAVIAAGLRRREELVRAGFDNVRRFGSDAMRDGYLGAYADALAAWRLDQEQVR